MVICGKVLVSDGSELVLIETEVREFRLYMLLAV